MAPIPDVINPAAKFALFDSCWDPRIIAELNGQMVKIARLEGEFIWHAHDNEDELFLVLKGELVIEFRNPAGSRKLSPGEMIVVPRRVEHRPVAAEEVHVLLFEPASTINTGTAKSDLTKANLKYI